jgi:excisionase family DNA binding protein
MMEIVKVGKVAELLKIKEWTVYQLVRRGIIPPGVVIHLGRQVQFDSDALMEWLRRGGTGSGDLSGRVQKKRPATSHKGRTTATACE